MGAISAESGELGPQAVAAQPNDGGRQAPKERRDNFVDYARLALALSVCLLHSVGGPFVTVGAAAWAVPGFLAISGFYILQSYERTGSWKLFAMKRVRRIGPALLVSVGLVAAVSASRVWPTLVCYGTLGQIQLGGNTNGALWSLGAEEIAYAALAVLFTFGAYRRVTFIWIALIVSCGIATYGAMLWTPGHPQPTLVLSLAPAFFSGSLIYIYRDRFKLGLAISAALIVSGPAIALGLGSRPTLPIGWVEGSLVGVGILAMRNFRVPRIPDLSYGCYIYHLPLLALFGHGLTFAVALPALCVVSWFLIEKPALSWRPGSFGPHSWCLAHQET